MLSKSITVARSLVGFVILIGLQFIIACCRGGRSRRIDRIEDAGAVVPEAVGTFSVIKQLGPHASALADIPELGGSDAVNRSACG